MQDIIGIRITCYFIEDIDAIYHILLQVPENIKDANNIDPEDPVVFKPKNLNMIFRMEEEHTKLLYDQLADADFKELIDNTYEVQLRSVLSEGWHEVEHDLRYKCHEDWNGFIMENRMMNGIYATLETSERAMSNLFSSLAHAHYKNSNWSAMIRSHFCIRMTTTELSPEIKEALTPKIAKGILRLRKSHLIKALWDLQKFPLLMDNIVFLANYMTIKDVNLLQLTPDILKKIFFQLKVGED